MDDIKNTLSAEFIVTVVSTTPSLRQQTRRVAQASLLPRRGLPEQRETQVDPMGEARYFVPGRGVQKQQPINLYHDSHKLCLRDIMHDQIHFHWVEEDRLLYWREGH